MMARSKAPLRVVADGGDDVRATEAGTVGVDGPPDIGSMLGFLFAREARLNAELADVRRQLDAQRIRYSKAHNLRVYAGLDSLRRQFGPSQ